MFPLGVVLTIIGVFYLSQRDVATNSKRRSTAGDSLVNELNELHSAGEVRGNPVRVIESVLVFAGDAGGVCV
jgi:hypothetical protein